ncbi:MAG TPA: hypothetical protein VHD60_00705 [Candidatus Saccharimonadales bacterium]|nr:hypothetical protein [Candidatus Saccharimonadales bacterium]
MHDTFPEVSPWRRRRRLLALAAAGLVVLGAIAFSVQDLQTGDQAPKAPPTSQTTQPPSTPSGYPLHNAITATMFWVGEPGDTDNKGISNVSSAWVDNWVKEFGGVDNPDKRCGYRPCAFVPKENAFYFALPFNDYDSNGNLKAAAILQQIPWYKGPPPARQSLVKNRWIEVSFQGKTAYAQWEDVGPFGENDGAYVFKGAAPQQHAGLDLSPAMNDYLNLSGEGTVSWRFVEATHVPNGPWKQVVTASGISY